MTYRMTYRAKVPDGARGVLVPGGLTTPHRSCTGVVGAGLHPVTEAATEQTAFWITDLDAHLDLEFRFSDAPGAYPEAMFVPHASPFTRYAEGLVTEVSACVGDLTGPAAARAIACHTAERFTYGHPETAFAEGMDALPALGCGLTEGSCVDINTYFIAALRLAGVEAGYVTGAYFPAEKNGACEDGHCWVVTRIDGQTHEWDIAHHLKMGTRDIRPGLNPKPGQRVATFHAMGLRFPEIGDVTLKALIEPLVLVGDRFQAFDRPEIRLHAPALA